MSTDWTAFPFKRALATAVAARNGITTFTPEVRVLTYDPSKDEPLTDSIVIGWACSDSGDHERAHAGGPRFDEQVDVECVIRVVRPGAGQEVADKAEDRAQALLAELDAEVRDNLPEVGDQTFTGAVIDRASDLFAWKTGDSSPVMVCLIQFSVRYKARTSS